MDIIHQRYKDAANEIRNNYFKTIEILNNKEDKIKKYQENIIVIMETIEKFMNENENKSLDIIEVGLKDKISNLDKNINLIKYDVEILVNDIKKMEKESHNLYEIISAKYPQLTEKDIQKEILYSLKK